MFGGVATHVLQILSNEIPENTFTAEQYEKLFAKRIAMGGNDGRNSDTLL